MADANLYTAKISEVGIMGTSDTQRSHRELRTDGAFDVLEAMVTAVDNKDRYTRRHSEDVTEYAMWTAAEMGFSEETMRVIRIGALLHDVGKIGVPEDVLRKPGKLTDEEYEVMKRHPQLGALIVAGMPGMEAIVDIVRSHHERWDGKGYPDALAAENIPVLGRLLAVADAFSAMTTARPYRKGMDWDVAIEEIRKNISTQFDPEMAQAFIKAIRKRRPLELVPSPAPSTNGTKSADKTLPGSATFSSSRRRSSDRKTRVPGADSNSDFSTLDVPPPGLVGMPPLAEAGHEAAKKPPVERRNLS
jgi:putative nucleotidyltransferase with HDIG domain